MSLGSTWQVSECLVCDAQVLVQLQYLLLKYLLQLLYAVVCRPGTTRTSGRFRRSTVDGAYFFFRELARGVQLYLANGIF